MPTIRSLRGIIGGAALVAAVLETARLARESLPVVLLVVGTVVALLLTRRTGGSLP